MIASLLTLNHVDIQALGITDDYSLHRIVYDLFEDKRSETEKKQSLASGILYLDQGSDAKGRHILLLSDRWPETPKHGQFVHGPQEVPASFLEHTHYRFEVIVNPTKHEPSPKLPNGERKKSKILPIKGREAIQAWFCAKAPQQWGFEVMPESLEVQVLPVQSFLKEGFSVTHNRARVQGLLRVTQREAFQQSFRQGIGRGRAFGFGLLHLMPVPEHE